MSLQDGVEVPALSRAAIRAHAVHVRKILNLGEGRFDAGQLLERLLDFGVVCDVFDENSAPVPSNVEACWVPGDNTLYIRDSVYDEMCRSVPRAIFTLGHEIGHIVLAHQQPLNRKKSPNDFPAYRNSEWQADCFAAELTMPLEVIQRLGLTTPKQVTEQFGVSMQAASNRINSLIQKNELTKEKPRSAPTPRGF